MKLKPLTLKQQAQAQRKIISKAKAQGEAGLDIELLLDNAATAAQTRDLLRDDLGNETALREAVRLNVIEPILRREQCNAQGLRPDEQHQVPPAAPGRTGSGAPDKWPTKEDYLSLVEINGKIRSAWHELRAHIGTDILPGSRFERLILMVESALAAKAKP